MWDCGKYKCHSPTMSLLAFKWNIYIHCKFPWIRHPSSHIPGPAVNFKYLGSYTWQEYLRRSECVSENSVLPTRAINPPKTLLYAWTKFDGWYDCEMLSSTNWHLCEWIIGLKGVLYPNLFLYDTALFMTWFVTFSQNKSTSSSPDSVLYLFIPWQNSVQFVLLNLVLTRWMMAHLFSVWDVALESLCNYAVIYFLTRG